MASFSLYDASVVPAKALLTSLRRILTVAEQHAPSSTLFAARLYDDMHPLTFQVHYSTAEAHKMVSTLSGKEPTTFQDDFTSYADMYERIDHVLGALDAADKDVVNATGETLIASPARGRENERIPVKALVSALFMPNISFYVSMTYAIVRKEGIPVGKRDYIRSFVSDYVE